jgi:hypothetical protein
MSKYDGRCGHCRTPKEAKAHQFRLRRVSERLGPFIEGKTNPAERAAVAVGLYRDMLKWNSR